MNTIVSEHGQMFDRPSRNIGSKENK